MHVHGITLVKLKCETKTYLSQRVSWINRLIQRTPTQYNTPDNPHQPDQYHLDQVKGEEVSLRLPDSVINTQPEHEEDTEEGDSEAGVNDTD